MKGNNISVIVFLVLIATALISICGPGGYQRLEGLRSELSSLNDMNVNSAKYVDQLRTEVTGLKGDDRLLEKAARGQMAVGRSNELVFYFEQKKGS